MKQVKHSKQRDLVLKAVCAKPVHPTADEVYNILRKDYPTLSLGTVYRNLQFLADNGVILRLSVPGTPDRYDGNSVYHCHAVCTKCGKLCDLPPECDTTDDRFAEKQCEYKITGHSVFFFGTCPDCEDK